MIADQPRPLIVTSDPALLDELLRLCAAAGVEPLVAADPAALTRAWRSAPVVLIGSQLAGAAAGLPRRSRVVIVGLEGEPLWEKAAEIGASHVAVLPSAGSWLVGLLSEPLPSAGSRAPVIAVVGGQGGAGASTLAAALARCASVAGTKTLLIDTDPFGGGLDLALGWESAEGHRWPRLLASGTANLSSLEGLPERSGLTVLATDREDPVVVSATAIANVIEAGQRGHRLVVVDLPRRVDEPAVAALSAATCTYLVVPAQVRAVAAAAQLARDLRQQTSELRAIVRGPAPGGLPAEAVARAIAVPLAAAVRPEPGLLRDYERGIAPADQRGPLHRLCQHLLRQHLGRGEDAERGSRSAA